MPDPNSMAIWLPWVKSNGIPHPDTTMIYTGYEALAGFIEGQSLSANITVAVEDAAEKLGYPCFIRTDLASGKHDFIKSCWVPKKSDLWRHMYSVVEHNFLAGILGLDPEYIVVREFLHLPRLFSAFQGMPVAKERRYFAIHGQVICHHPYWIENAIAEYEYHQPPLPKDWKEALAIINQEGLEVPLLTSYAEKVSADLTEPWSIDFAEGADNKWYLIDMALAKNSWHPECDAPNAVILES